jgi:hypothetical protein
MSRPAVRLRHRDSDLACIAAGRRWWRTARRTPGGRRCRHDPVGGQNEGRRRERWRRFRERFSLVRHSVRRRTSNLGAVDLSARSGADRVSDAIADRHPEGVGPCQGRGRVYVQVAMGLVCGRASSAGLGSGLAAGHPGGLALTPASDDADLSSGSEGRRGARVGVGVSHRGPHDLRMAARLGCRGIPSPIGLASMVRSGHDQTGFKQFVDLAAGGGGHADHGLASGRVRVSRR